MTLNFAVIVMILVCVSGAFAGADQEIYIENSNIKVGVNLAAGGAITYVSKIDGPNIINSYDWGRQIQQSYYSGPNNYTREGKEKNPAWAGFCWNPIQSGDSYGNGSKVLDYRRNKQSLYVKTRPMLWPMRDDPGECIFETWITLKGSTFTWRARLTNERTDRTMYGEYAQEIPAVYTNGPWHRLLSYTGDKPFTGGDLAEIRNDHGEPWPWTRFLATERWAALVDEKGNGIGVWHPTAGEYNGGFAGRRGKGGPKDAPTGYMAPMGHEILDYNIVYDYKCVFIVGSIGEIRDFARKHAPSSLPRWTFNKNRAGWTYQNALDDGWPVKNGINISANTNAQARLVSPLEFWRAESAPYAAIRATVSQGAGGEARLYWRKMADNLSFNGKEWGEWFAQWWVPERSTTVPFIGDGKERWYVVDLGGNPAYKGGIIGLALDLPHMAPDARIGIHEIRLLKKKDDLR